MLYKEEEH